MRASRPCTPAGALALAAVLAALAGSCGPRRSAPGTATADSTLTAEPVGTGSKSQVTFVEVTPHTRRVALPLGSGGDSLLLRPSAKGRTGGWSIQRRAGADGTTTAVGSLVGALEAAGTVDLHHDGTREAFLVASDGGSGLTNRELDLYCTPSEKLLTLTLTFMHDATEPVPSVVRSDELEQPPFAPEASFLEGIKRDYGYVSEADLARGDDPARAFYYWRTDNAGHVDGAPLKLRRFPGRRAGMGSIEDSLVVGGVTYTAYFKSGVVAYDPAANEHWVMFHPDDPFDWPTHLATAGDVLVIGTRGEGLVFVKLPTLQMRRMRVLGNDTVQQLEVRDSLVVVNGAARVAVPEF